MWNTVSLKARDKLPKSGHSSETSPGYLVKCSNKHKQAAADDDG